ncbi:MAG: hypothetical protein R3200_10450 [Xanthomonadales bacterium]|nr:hypothetical protein [Xanthomonadales bacterium]
MPGGIPDARDGLTRLQRVILYELHKLQRERPDKPSIPVIQLYGRVIEHIDCSEEELQEALQSLGAAGKTQS